MDEPQEFFVNIVYEGVMGCYYTKEEAVKEAWRQDEELVTHVIEKPKVDEIMQHTWDILESEFGPSVAEANFSELYNYLHRQRSSTTRKENA